MLSLHNSKFYTFFITFLLIATSGTVYIGRLYYHQSLIVLLVGSMLLFKRKINMSGLIWFLVIGSLLLMNLLLSGNTDTSTFVTTFIKIISVFFIFNAINLKLVARYYVYIMASVCGISLFFYGFGVLFPDFVLTHIPIIEAWGNPLRITLLYVYSAYYTFRNNGIYWEPGAFQVFINIAVYLSINLELKKKTNRFLYLLFFITLITTFSITGYLVYALVILSQYKKWIKSVNLAKLSLIAILLIAVFTIEEKTMGAVSKKFDQSSYSYGSTERRGHDTAVGFDLMSKKPFVGWGLGNRDMYYGYDISASSNGLMIVGSQFGIIFLAVYLVTFLVVIKYFSKGWLEPILLFSAFIAVTGSQDLLFYPIFLSPIFIATAHSRIKKKSPPHNREDVYPLIKQIPSSKGIFYIS